MPEYQREYLREINERLERFAKDLHDEADRISDDRGKLLYETAAEALDQLRRAFKDYDLKEHEVWRP